MDMWIRWTRPWTVSKDLKGYRTDIYAGSDCATDTIPRAAAARCPRRPLKPSHPQVLMKWSALVKFLVTYFSTQKNSYINV